MFGDRTSVLGYRISVKHRSTGRESLRAPPRPRGVRFHGFTAVFSPSRVKFTAVFSRFHGFTIVLSWFHGSRPTDSHFTVHDHHPIHDFSTLI